MTDTTDHVEALLTKSSSANQADEAMKFAQAALNAANARRVQHDTKQIGGK